MQELDEEIKLHNAGGDDAQDTSDVSTAAFYHVFVTFQIMHFFFAADQ